MTRSSNANHRHSYPQWPIAIGIVAVFGILLIAEFPSFYADEFPIFGEIALHPTTPFKTNPTAEYHLFFRPLSHLILWLYFQSAGANAVLMKCFNLALALLLLYVVRRYLLKFLQAESIKSNESVIMLLLLWLGTHPSTLHSVLFISNVTELLAGFFYACALMFILESWETEKKGSGRAVVLAIAAFITSILSKQTGIHLPLTILLFGLLTSRLRSSTERKRTLQFSLISGTIAALIAFSNYVFLVQNDWTPWREILWRIPFRIANSLVYSFVPLYAIELHYFFSSHKVIAVVVGALGLVILFVALRKLKLLRAPLIGWVILGFSVYFPLALIAAGDRLQTIPLLWAVIGGAYLTGKIPTRIYSTAIGVLVVLNIVASAQLPVRLGRVAQYADHVCTELIRVSSAKNTDIIVADPYLGYDPSYMVHFKRTGNFGKDPRIGYPRIHSWIPLYWDGREAELRRRFTVYRKGDTIVTVALPGANIVLPTHRTGRIVHSTPHSRFTGFESITFLQEVKQVPQEDVCLYWNGITWEEIE